MSKEVKEEKEEAILISEVTPLKEKINLRKISIYVLLCSIIIVGTFYALLMFSSEKETPVTGIIETAEKISPTPSSGILSDELIKVTKSISITLTSNEEENSRPTPITNPKVTPPSIFGFTKLIDLPGIGVRALFPQNTVISYTNPYNNYIALFPNGSIYFTLYEYTGGSRRVWFRENIGRPESIFESFGANNHQGYLSYSKDSRGKVYETYYFTVVRTNKMLVIQYSSETGNAMLESLKSFISTLQIIQPNLQGIERQDQEQFETQRWSNNRKIIWEDINLGLRISAPEWIETRLPKGKKSDGTWDYSDWTRVNPEVKIYNSSYYSENVVRVEVRSGNFFNPYLSILSQKQQGKTFSDLVNELLIPAGFCTTEWKSSKSQCADINSDYCYTRDEVVQNLVLKKTAKFGPHTGQLRGINASFSQKRDCRGEDIWLLQVKGGQFVLSTILSDTKSIILEGF